MELNRGWQEGERGGCDEEERVGASAAALCGVWAVVVRQVGIQVRPWKLWDHGAGLQEGHRSDPRHASQRHGSALPRLGS